MKKNLLRLGLLCLTLLAAIVVNAQDVTATWDFTTDPLALSDSSLQGNVKTLENNGVTLTIDATNGNVRNNSNSYQMTTGTILKVPVKTAKDTVWVKGYPGYYSYSVGGVDATAQDVTHKVTSAEATAGYVEIISTGNNNYLYSVTVKHVSLIQEKQLYYTDFTEWTDAKAATSESQVTWNTKYSHETLTFSIYNTQISSVNGNTGKFPNWDGGYAMASKAADPYITTSALSNVTKVHFLHGATGGNRGWKLECKGDGDDDWVVLSDAVASTAAGTNVDVDVNRTNVQLRFTNLNSSQNAYLFELAIYGNVDYSQIPTLESFEVNGTKIDAQDIFSEDADGNNTADIEISKSAKMISETNPITNVVATNGEVTSIAYESATDNQTKATIQVTLGEKTATYMANFVWKPDYTLTYINTDGTTIGTQTVEKDATIGTFAYDVTNVTVAEGLKFRGWFVESDGGRKYTTSEVITSNLSLYAVATEIEVESTSKTYIYNLTDKYFYAEDHEGFVPTGQGKFHDTTHGWEFKNGDKVNILVGGNAYILFDLCKYGSAGTISLSNAAGDDLGSVTVPVSTDGTAGSIKYKGSADTLTLTFNGGAYLHKLTVANTTDNPIEKNEAGYYIVNANDGNHFLATLTIANAASSADSRSIIFLPNGTYDLGSACLTPINGKNISIVGQSTDGVVIKNLPEAEGIGITATLYNTSTNLYMQDLTLQNALDYYNSGSAGRAVCLQDKGNHTIAKNVKMLSYQDTYYSNAASQLYWEDSEIHGTVDYLCGDGDVYYNRCKFVNEKRNANGSGECTIAAPYTTTTWGYVMQDCTIETLSASFNLGRAWGGKPRIAWLNTTILEPSKIASKRFTASGMNVAADKFVEYHSIDSEGNIVSPESNIVKFTKDSNVNEMETILTAEQSAEYAIDKVFTDWNPKTLAAQVEMSNTPVIENGAVKWDAVEGATAYAVFENDQLLAITTGTTVQTSESTLADESLNITVRAANTMGGFGPATKAVTTGINAISENTPNVTAIAYYSANGMKLQKPQAGVNVRVKTLANGQTITDKVIVK